jgi:carbon-monoxide dehydrogenase medium subunit
MKPGRFRYLRPSSVEEAVEILAEYGDEAKVLAGGQSLIPMMNMRLARPAVLVDINRVAGLTYVTDRQDGVAFGASTRQRSLELDDSIPERLPLLPAVAEWMSHPQIRNRGTVVGSVVHADPAAELPAAALALEATIRAVSRKGDRTISALNFYLGYYATELQPDELVTEVIFPRMTPDMGWAVYEVCRRRGDFALAGMITLLRIDGSGCLSDVRMAAYGLGGSAFRLKDLEMDLVGQEMSEGLLGHAARRAAELATADDDIHATGEYRRALAGETARRTLRSAAEMAAAQSNERRQ